MAGTSHRKFVTLVGFNTGLNGKNRYEIGDPVENLPGKDVAWMLDEGIIAVAPSTEGGD